MELLATERIDKNLPIIIGVSGGADSMALLHLLNAEGYKLVIAHCNFHLRGEESDRDEQFVRDVWMKKYPKQALEVIEFDTEGYAQEHKVSIEMAARNLRYEWFRLLKEEHQATCIAIAHHADDQIETLLLNLSRGTGGQGLVGMEVFRDNIWRPLLGTTRAEILEYLAAFRLQHIEDSTNQEIVFKRNLIRHELIPLFERLNPSFRTSALRSMELFAEEQALIESMVLYWKKVNYDEATASFALSEDMHTPLLLYRWLSSMGYTADQIDKLYSHRHESGATFVSPEGKTIERFRGRGYFIEIPREIDSQDVQPGKYELGNIGSLAIGTEEGQLKISPKMLERRLTLRTAKRGDKFKVFGQKSGCRDLFDFLKDMGIPAAYREFVPVLTESDDVIAVPPLQISETARVHDGEEPVTLRFNPGTSPLAQILIR